MATTATQHSYPAAYATEHYYSHCTGWASYNVYTSTHVLVLTGVTADDVADKLSELEDADACAGGFTDDADCLLLMGNGYATDADY